MMFIELKKHFPVRVQEWFAAGMLTSWGAYVILHPGMFTGVGAIFFSGLVDIAPERVWGLSAFTAGIIRLGALYINGTWTRTPLIRLAVSFLSIFLWFFISVGLMRSDIPQGGLVIYPWLLIMDMYSAYRAASDAYEAEAQRRLDIYTQGQDRSDVVTPIRRR